MDRGDGRIAAGQAPERQPGRQEFGVGDRRAEAGGQVSEQTRAGFGSCRRHRLVKRLGDARAGPAVGFRNRLGNAREVMPQQARRSEERRVGKECRSRWSAERKKKKKKRIKERGRTKKRT